MCSSVLQKILLVLVLVGGLNWGLMGLMGFNLVAWLFGGTLSWASRTVYLLVGASAICLIPCLFAGSQA